MDAADMKSFGEKSTRLGAYDLPTPGDLQRLSPLIFVQPRLFATSPQLPAETIREHCLPGRFASFNQVWHTIQQYSQMTLCFQRGRAARSMNCCFVQFDFVSASADPPDRIHTRDINAVIHAIEVDEQVSELKLELYFFAFPSSCGG